MDMNDIDRDRIGEVRHLAGNARFPLRDADANCRRCRAKLAEIPFLGSKSLVIAASHCGPGFAQVCHNRRVGDATTCPKQLHLFPSGPLNL